MIFYSEIDSPVGKIGISSEDGFLIKLTFGSEPKEIRPDAVTEETAKQLREYFSGKRTEFSVPIKMQGTDFQKRVWNHLREIPYGSTVAYSFIAEKIGNPNASRAVGNANNKNKIPIIIPCHRVVGKDGTLIGYASGNEIKKFLIDMEAAVV